MRSTNDSPGVGLQPVPAAAWSARVCSRTWTLSVSAVSSSRASGPTGRPACSAAFSITGAGRAPPSLAADDFDQFHLVHRAEEVDADELPGPGAGLGQAGDRQGRGVAGEKTAGCE